LNLVKNPSLIFAMALPSSAINSMVEGILKLVDGDLDKDVAPKLLNAYRASSSRPNHQYWASWRQSGGVIPPDEPWKVATTAINMPDNPGVGGLFFPLTPFEVETIGDVRGDFGVHKDANRASSPGSLGCLFPLSDPGWVAIKRDFATAAAAGFKYLPLQVHYTHN
jgi:hypothetical protein